MAEPKRLYFTFDLEDHRPDDSYGRRYPAITRQVLDWLEARGIAATVFVMGRLVHEEPALVREIAARGHEVGFHSLAHVHLTRETPERLRSETAREKAFLEDLIGAPVLGYRAPAFSLTRASVWATDVIAELGFRYSSSVCPAQNPVFGFPGAPRRAFHWPNGLLEIPAPLTRIGPLTIPFLGGIYLRYLPHGVVRRCLRRGAGEQVYWLYCHPHDFDHESRLYRVEGTSWPTSILLWLNRRRTFQKLDAVLAGSDTAAMRSFATAIAAGDFAGVPVFDPG